MQCVFNKSKLAVAERVPSDHFPSGYVVGQNHRLLDRIIETDLGQASRTRVHAHRDGVAEADRT